MQFADAPAKGQLVLEKTADLFQSYEAKETEYGTLYQPVFEEGLLANVTYEIRAREDIKSADGTYTSLLSMISESSITLVIVPVPCFLSSYSFIVCLTTGVS